MPIPSPFVPAIALRWQQNISDLREYEVVRDGNIFQTNLSRSSIFSSEYEQAQRLKFELIEKYPENALESVFTGEEVKTDAGSIFCIHSFECVTDSCVDRGLESSVLSDLTLIRGIGPITAHRLKIKGFQTIRDLLQHPKYRNDAADLLSHCAVKDAFSLMSWIGKRHYASHPLILTIAECIEKEGFSFLDIETLGIFSRPIILMGLAQIQGDRVHIRQYLLRDIDEEPAVLEAAFAQLSKSAAFVTFNGKSFDLPYLQERAAYYGMPFPCKIPHFDLLHFSRRKWKNAFTNCRLQTLERSLFGLQREMDIPGALVPEFYEAYLTSGSPGPLVPIVEHNRQDVLSLVHLFRLLREETACQ
jgi:uncharacterized protein YprB with RNaseH-like and TPR domain